MDFLKNLFTTAQGWIAIVVTVGGSLNQMLPDLLEQITQGYGALVAIGGGIALAVKTWFDSVKPAPKPEE